MIRVLVVDDCNIIREGIRAFLRSIAGIEVMGCVANGVEAISAIKQNPIKPDIVIMDLIMPVMGGIKATEEIASQFEDDIKILVLSDVKNYATISCALSSGAVGYLFKQHIEKLANIIQVVNEGYVLIEPEILTELLNHKKEISVSMENEKLEGDLKLTVPL